jgi:hypothetical protein
VASSGVRSGWRPGWSSPDLKELGEHLDTGEAGLVVVAFADADAEAKVERAMQRAAKVQQKELKADTAEIERDAGSAVAEATAS